MITGQPVRVDMAKVAMLDRIMLDGQGRINLLSAAFFGALDPLTLRGWCHMRARYGLVTIELIDWLKGYIGDRKTIEIGSGSGDLCLHLGIPGIDNYQQRRPDVEFHYQVHGQPTIQYGSWVEQADAIDGVRKYTPDIVIGSWITHWIDPDKPMPPAGGNMYGVKEDKLLELVDTYIMIGNLDVHKGKPILKRPHETYEFPFLKSRASRPDLDRIFIWWKG